MKKFAVVVFTTLLLVSSCAKTQGDKMIVSKLDTAKVQKSTFKPYSSCNVEWRSSLGVGVDVQNCFIKGKKLTVVPSESLGGYYIGIDSGSGMVLQELAIQIFDEGAFSTPEEGVAKVLKKITNGGSSQDFEKCSFVKDYRLSDDKKSIYSLIGNITSDGTTSRCGDYGYQNKNHFRYFVVFKGKEKIIFVNQLKEKRLFDEQSIQIIN